MIENSKVVETGTVRLSHVHVFEPFASLNGGEPKYSVTMLIPKSDVRTKQLIDAAIETAKREGAAKRWQGVMPPVVATPLHDGDGPRPSDGLPYGTECRGHWVMTASSRQAPGVVDYPGRNRIMDPNAVYSGMYGRAIITFYAYSNSGKKGVGCGLQHVQKLADGEPLDNRIPLDAAFTSEAADIPAQQYAQQYPQIGYGADQYGNY